MTYNTVDPKSHTRTYSASAYYLPNADRENFVVATRALVNRAILEKTESREVKAIGVEVLSADQKIVIKAKKEVIFSAGLVFSISRRFIWTEI
jgi:choline dehydrogenase-like flavoprotein